MADVVVVSPFRFTVTIVGKQFSEQQLDQSSGIDVPVLLLLLFRCFDLDCHRDMCEQNASGKVARWQISG